MLIFKSNWTITTWLQNHAQDSECHVLAYAWISPVNCPLLRCVCLCGYSPHPLLGTTLTNQPGEFLGCWSAWSFLRICSSLVWNCPKLVIGEEREEEGRTGKGKGRDNRARKFRPRLELCDYKRLVCFWPKIKFGELPMTWEWPTSPFSFGYNNFELIEFILLFCYVSINNLISKIHFLTM